METFQETNAIRTVLRSEITWVIFIIGTIWGGVTGIILPLQKVQIQLIQMQSQIASIQIYGEKITQNSNDILVLQEKIKNLYN